MAYVCIKKCFYLNRLWTPGMVLESTPNGSSQKYFKEKSKVSKKEEKNFDAPTTFLDLQKKEAEEMLSAVGHKSQASKKPGAKKSSKAKAAKDDFLE